MPAHPLEEILQPQSIAVAGASNNPSAPGYNFTYHLLDYGYQGRIYPVNPSYSEVLGIKAYPNIKDIPGSVDYVISAVPAQAVLGMLEDCSQKGVKCVHLYTARFSETGRRDAAELEQEILKQARKYGIRLIGPNCMGLYYPRLGIAFAYDFPKEAGSVGMASQTGGGAGYFIHLASLRGIRFSKVISYGNGLDFNESDYLDYLSQDLETKIILLYIEGIRDGKRFFESLSRAAAAKPVIVIKGGRGKAGMRAAFSHTAALTSSAQLWETVVAQAGAILARNFQEMADLAVSFQFLPPIRGTRVGIAGGGGGTSVLAADECEETGLEAISLPTEIREELRGMGIPVWDWIGNPVDTSITGGVITPIDMLRMMARNHNFDLLVAIINEDAPSAKKDMILRRRNEIKGYLQLKKEGQKPLLVVAGEKSAGIEYLSHWRQKEMSRARTKLIAANIPWYPTIGQATKAIRKLIDYYQKRQ